MTTEGVVEPLAIKATPRPEPPFTNAQEGVPDTNPNWAREPLTSINELEAPLVPIERDVPLALISSGDPGVDVPIPTLPPKS